MGKKKRTKRTDGWKNELTGLSNFARDKRTRAEVNVPTNFTHQELENLFSGDDIARKIVIKPAEEMARGGGTLETEDGEVSKETAKWLDSNMVLTKFTEAQTWANLFGGAAILMGIPGEAEEPVLPKDASGIEFLTVLDRYELSAVTYYDDAMHPKFRLPETYALARGATSVIHESRLLIFEGGSVTRQRREKLSGWGEPLLTPVADVIRDFDQAWAGLSHLLSDYSQAIWKIKGLSAALAQDQQQVIKARLVAMDMARSMTRAVIVDADGEEFNREATNLAGIPETLTKFETRLAYAADMPATVLFGKSPDGMNATGASDLQLWYDRIDRLRDTRWTPLVNRLLTHLFVARDGPTNGKIPDSWSWQWANLQSPDDLAVAQSRNTQAQTDKLNWEMGVISADEIRESRFGGDGYSFETTVEGELTLPIDDNGEENS